MLRLSLLLISLAQLPPSPDPRPLPIRGAVVDDLGRPVAGADVWLADALSPDEGRRFGLELWWSSMTGTGEGTPPILVHARTDRDGSFAVELPAEAVARRSPPPMALWAADGKGLLGFRRLPRIVLADDPPVRVALGPTPRLAFTLLTPERRPAAGARVVPTRLGDAPVPESVGRLLGGVADARGRVDIGGITPSAPGRVRVEADGFGVQVLDIDRSGIEGSRKGRPDAEGLTVALAPVGRIHGRLVAPGEGPIRGVTVRATSQAGGYLGTGQGGSARAECDEHGRFEIPAIAAGMVAFDVAFDPASDCPWRVETPAERVLRAGQAIELIIPMRETMVVRGRFREKGTDRPIAGVKVELNGRTGGDRFVLTGADGRFAGRIFRDVTQPFGWSVRMPSPFYEPDDMADTPQRMPPPGVLELELPPTEPSRGVDVRGSIVGEDGRPVAGALVEASWHDSRQLDQEAMARSDREGRFVLHGVAPLAELDLTAWDGFGAATLSITATAAAERPIAMTISPKHAVPIGGRVVDAGGRPIARASVRIRRQVQGRALRVILDEPADDADASSLLLTDADGRFHSRGRFPARSRYYAEARAPGWLATRSTPVDGDLASRKPTVLVLGRVRDVEGRVVDRRGRPVAGAVARQSGDGPIPTEATTDADGRFRLPGVIEGPALILAAKEGYRSALQPVADGTKPVAVVLARAEEPSPAPRALPPALPIDEEKALALRLIEPLAAPVLARGDDRAKYRFLSDAAVIAPENAIEWLDEVKFADPDYVNLVRIELATAMARESLDEAATLLEPGSPYARAQGYATMADDVPGVPAARRRALFDQAILNSKTTTPLSYRFTAIGQIADRLLDLGEADRARALLDEGRELGRSIPPGDRDGRWAKLAIVGPLARLDLPAALKIMGDLEEYARKTEARDRSQVFDRYYGQIAYGLADRSPADAEAVLGRMHVRNTGDRAIVAACTRMAAKDPARARRIVATRISPESPAFRPYALGLMARAIADTDRPAAARMLAEAFDELERLAPIESERTSVLATTAAGALLPAVERVAPDRLAEYLGRVLLMRHPRGDQVGLAENVTGFANARLAMLTARYDRALAACILRPELERLGSHQASFGMDYISASVLAALSLIDPHRAAAMVEALPDDPPPGTDPNGTKSDARRSVARMLALHGDDRWRLIARDYLYLWTPEQRSP